MDDGGLSLLGILRAARDWINSGATPQTRQMLSMLANPATREQGWNMVFDPERAMEHPAAQAGMNLAPMGLAGAIKVYHGSPHVFDKFDISKINTGQGAQAYGHGLYFAEHPDVAKDYRATTTLDRYMNAPLEDQRIMDAIQTSGGSDMDAMKTLASTGRYKPEDFDRLYERMQKLKPDTGALYEAELRWPDPAREAADPLGPQHFLDWDKPLSEQTQQVQNALLATGDPVIQAWSQNGAWPHVSGEVAYRHLAGGITRGAVERGIPAQASSNLASDVPGIRYLDAGSRGAGQGTANYVLFDDTLANILARNGVPLP